MAFGISAAISKEIGSPPADPNPHRAENSHSAEKVLGKKPSTDGDAPQDQDSGIQTPCPARTSHNRRPCSEDINVSSRRHRSSGLALIPSGSWPRRMSAPFAGLSGDYQSTRWPTGRYDRDLVEEATPGKRPYQPDGLR